MHDDINVPPFHGAKMQINRGRQLEAISGPGDQAGIHVELSSETGAEDVADSRVVGRGRFASVAGWKKRIDLRRAVCGTEGVPPPIVSAGDCRQPLRVPCNPSRTCRR